MLAYAVRQFLPADAPGCFVELNLTTPSPGPHDLLVRVKAIAINQVDIKRRKAQTSDQPPKVLGWDASGIVEQVGEAVSGFQPGDAIYYAGSLDREGCYTEQHLVDYRLAALKPKELNFEQAAALPFTSITAWEAIFERLMIRQDDPRDHTVLVIGGAGGVGSLAIQLLRQMTGLTIVATASREESTAWCKEMGAHHVINHLRPLKPQLDQLGIAMVQYVLCLSEPVAHWHNICDCLAPMGRICALADAGGPIDMNQLKWKSATFVWECHPTRPMYVREEMARHGEILTKIARMIDKGQLRTTMHQSLGQMTAQSLARGHRYIETGHTIGKLTLTVGNDAD